MDVINSTPYTSRNTILVYTRMRSDNRSTGSLLVDLLSGQRVDPESLWIWNEMSYS